MSKKTAIKIVSLSLIAVLGSCEAGETNGEESGGTLETEEVFEPTVEDSDSGPLSFDEQGEESAAGNEHETEEAQLEKHTDQPVEEKEDIAHQEFPVSLGDAVNHFIEEVGQEEVNISEISFVQDYEEYAYHVYGWDGNHHYYSKLNAETGEQLEYREEENNEQLGYIEWRDVLSPMDAVQFSLEEAGADSATDWKLFVEEQNHFTAYEVVIQNEENQYINAYNGNILPQENIEE